MTIKKTAQKTLTKPKIESNCSIDIVGNNLWILTEGQPEKLSNTVTFKDSETTLLIDWQANENELIAGLLNNFNLLKNGTFTNVNEKSLDGWELDVSEPSSAGVDLSEEWHVQNGHTAFLFAPKEAGRPSIIAAQKIPALENGNISYFFSGYFATHRAGALVNIDFYDQGENKLGHKVINVPLDSRHSGGQSLVSYAHIKSTFTPIKKTRYIRFSIQLGEQEDFTEPHACLFFMGLCLGQYGGAESIGFLPYSDSIERLTNNLLNKKWLGFGNITLPVLDEIASLSVEYLNQNYKIDLKDELAIIRVIEEQNKKQEALASAKKINYLGERREFNMLNEKDLLGQIELLKQINLVKEMFDEEYYSSQLGFISENGVEHFLKEGYLLDLSPNPYFDPQWYQQKFNIDKNEINPFIHFCLHGYKEGKSPSENFEIGFYFNEYLSSDDKDANPLLHYMHHGKKAGSFKSSLEKQRNDLEKILNQFESNADENYIDLSKFQLESQDEQFLEYLLENKRGNLGSVEIDAKCELVSLDIWDTVLRRKVHPDEIKLSAARYLYINYYWQLKPAYRSIDALYKARRVAEDKSSLTKDYEYRYADAIAIWLPTVYELGISNTLMVQVRNELLEHELSAEKRASQIDSGMLKFLRQKKFSQMVFASDFYMPASFINQLLKVHGITDLFTKGYASCDLIMNKRSGELYDHILDEFRLKPEQVLHIGDNKHSDINVPDKKGFKVFYYHDKHENKLHAWFAEALQKHLEGDSSIHERRLLSILEHKTRNIKESTGSTLKKIGIRFAPVAIGLILKILEDAKRMKVEKVYFFTREGIFLKELYDLVVQADPYYSSYPESELLEVSRLATFAPSLTAVNTDNLMRLWNQYSDQSPKAFCRTLNIDSEELQVLFEKFALPYDQVVIYPWENSRFIELIDSSAFQAIVQRTIAAQKANLKQYLNEKGLSSGKGEALFVDLGWRGTIQDNLSFVIDRHSHGIYLGLFKYINEQPDGVSKTGWLFDQNVSGESWSDQEVGPIEMLFNSLGGSTISYQKSKKGMVAVKKEEEAEDEVFASYTVYLQEGIKSALNEVIEYISIHALTSDNLKNIARQITQSLIAKPPAEFAHAFFNLTHNETFGTGEYQTMMQGSTIEKSIQELSGSELHYKLRNFLAQTRWKKGFYCLESTQKIVNNFAGDISHIPLEFYQNTILKDKKNNFKVGIYAPQPIAGSGGHRTIFNLARKFVDAGCEVYCFIEAEGSGIESVRHYLAGANAYVHIGWPTHLELDMAVATIAYSAQIIAKMPNVKHKAYLVQDFEAWFNPVGDTYNVAESSYTFGLVHFTVGKFLTHILQKQYAAQAIPAGLGVDTNVYFDQQQTRENAICFLYQPEKFRRTPKLAIDALRIVKLKQPDLKIYVYGSDAPIHLDFDVENLGLIHDLTELNALYNKCKVGICISMTNPSRIPFELMASGVVPVDIYRYNNLLDYPSGTIQLAYQSSESIAEAVLGLFSNKKALQSRQESCREFAETRTLEWETDVFVNNALSIMHGSHVKFPKVKSSYAQPVCLASQDKGKEIKAFCGWQKKLAG